MNNSVLLNVNNLKKHFKVKSGMLHAVDDISFSIEKGKTLGLVGESGCGKSTTGRVILRLLEPTSGEVLFEGANLGTLSQTEMRKMRCEMQMIFQDPFSSLDPRKTVSEAIAEPLALNKIIKNPRERLKRVMELMDIVGLAPRLANANLTL